MPNKPSKACAAPSCPNHAVEGSNYCANHKKADEAMRYKVQKETGVHKAYETRNWPKVRRIQLNKHPMCQCPSCREHFLVADTVHHKDGNPFNNLESNLMSVEAGCHNKIHKAVK